MRIERITGCHFGLWAGPEDALWLELGWWSVCLGCDSWEWVNRGGEWGIRVESGGVWWKWGYHSFPPRRFGLPFVGKP